MGEVDAGVGCRVWVVGWCVGGNSVYVCVFLCVCVHVCDMI